jgi:tetratricopeptide (TPR) repeat protein
MGDRDQGEVRYRAFLSYSHKDAAAAGRLHRRLEAYRVPRRLAGRDTARGPVPSRLWPIFRDREELPAATDLSETVREALARSGALIILCSPHAAASLWVAEEIRVFRELHPGRPILAAILDGDPPDCFPDLLRAMGDGHEPLATDLRRDRDGERLGLLKLVAGITGLGLDDLVQRDATRRVRRVMAVTAAALAAMLVMAVLVVVAVSARREAERQRAEAEGQIEFMLTDLRTKLEGVGRLDIMNAVNQQALRYYGGQEELSGLSSDSLQRRARILLAMGEDDVDRDRYAAAFDAFRQAHRITEEQLARAPDDPTLIYAHAQSEYYVGYAAYLRHDYARTLGPWRRYKALAERLVAINPRNADWIKETAFAEGGLCNIALALHDYRAALPTCLAALRRMEQAARVSGSPASYGSDLANRHSYVGDALRSLGRREEALIQQQQRLAYLERQLAGDPANARLRARRLWALRAIANLEADMGRRGEAARRMSGVADELAALIRHDPANADWQRELTGIRTELSQIQARRH